MVHMKDGLVRATSVRVSFILLTHFCGGQLQQIDPPQQVMVMVGEDIVLPCQLEPPVDAVSMTMEWGRVDLDPRFVYVWDGGQELLDGQNEAYRGRASLSINKLKHGDLSLTLSEVNVSDNGTYRCYIPTWHKEYVVELVVGAVASPGISFAGIHQDSSGVVLDCTSEGWYPQPELSWLDSEGNVLPAGPTETVRGPDGLYTVSSRVTVDKTHNNTFTCRVRQKTINQTRETHVHVPERKKEGERREQEEFMTFLEKKKEKLDEEVKKKEEEEEDMTQVTEILKEVMNGLTEQKEKLTVQFKEAERLMEENEKKRGPKWNENSNLSADYADTSPYCSTTPILPHLCVPRFTKIPMEKKNVQLQKENKEKDWQDVLSALMEVKTELENQRDRLRVLLEEVEREKEGNKQKLQAVEEEITEREKAFDKPEELLREKESLLRAQWKLDQTKKDNESQLLNTERLLEPIETQVTRIHREKEVNVQI
ncbi:butyrophilin subfamily 2 member A1-like [Chaetodon trifascialis]|uniref:butyrophilin subfamily 2 member A1-like n=1 Tax=Chaetodon trifascialis TaxID=109706 RepID=UPI003993EC1C